MLNGELQSIYNPVYIDEINESKDFILLNAASIEAKNDHKSKLLKNIDICSKSDFDNLETLQEVDKILKDKRLIE